MSWRTRSLIALLAGSLLVAGACSSDDDASSPPATDSSADTTTTVDEGAVDALDTSMPGPYGVGRRTVTIVDPDREDRNLVTDIWYPTDAADGPASTYSFAPGIEYDSEVALDAPPVSGDGPFPLVVYSHGSGGQRYVSTFLTETLASHGVVVVAPDHAGNTTLDQFTGSEADRETIVRDRPLDVSRVLDAVLDGSVDQEITDIVDADAIGLIGHSFGAYTTLAVGGGVAALGIHADERVSVLVPLAPAVGGLSDGDLAAVDVPTMVISGTLDETTPISPNTERVVDLVEGPLTRVDLEGATHQSFTDVCDYTTLLRDLEVDASLITFVDEFAGRTCDTDVLDIDRAHDLINRYAIAFLLAELADDAGARATLDAEAPDAVEVSVTDG